MSKNAAIVVLSNPEAGEDALGRVFNALAAAADFRERGGEVKVLFQGAATRWPEQLSRPDHPANALYRALDGQIAASAACADVFGATDKLKAAKVPLEGDNPVPGTRGLPSLAALAESGWLILTF